MRGQRAILLFAGAILCSLVPAAAAADETPDLDGHYRLTKRVLPDGTELTAPDIVGYMSMHAGYRNFNVAWSGPEGERVSLGLISTFTVSATELCESVSHWAQVNLGVPGAVNEPPAEKAECSKVSSEDGVTRIDLNGELPYLLWTDAGFSATAEGAFVDYWERVEK